MSACGRLWKLLFLPEILACELVARFALRCGDGLLYSYPVDVLVYPINPLPGPLPSSVAMEGPTAAITPGEPVGVASIATDWFLARA